MPRIKSRLDVSSPAFLANAAHHRALADDLRAQVARVAESAAHVRVNVLDTEKDAIDVALAARGLARNLVLTVPHFSVVPMVVERTGAIATLSSRLASVYAAMMPVVLRPPPLPLPARSAQMIWHERTDTDEGARFFRTLLREATSDFGP